jgi:hypothetical protein
LAQSQPDGFFQFDGLAGVEGSTWFEGVIGFVGVMGTYLAARSARFPWELAGGEVMTLGAADGGTGHESSDGEKTPLLAMLMPPMESWLERRGATAGGGV